MSTIVKIKSQGDCLLHVTTKQDCSDVAMEITLPRNGHGNFKVKRNARSELWGILKYPGEGSVNLKFSDSYIVDGSAAIYADEDAWVLAITNLVCSVCCGDGAGGGPGGDMVGFEAFTSNTTTSPFTIVRAVASGSIVAGKAAWEIHNSGGEGALVNGQVLLPGENLRDKAYVDPDTKEFVRCSAVTYDGTGTELLIFFRD